MIFIEGINFLRLSGVLKRAEKFLQTFSKQLQEVSSDFIAFAVATNFPKS